uniref:Uncharacterized protein n=1 Tax=Manihot esculenta TaxID=3983 RepID=A0A199UCL8_MANES
MYKSIVNKKNYNIMIKIIMIHNNIYLVVIYFLS